VAGGAGYSITMGKEEVKDQELSARCYRVDHATKTSMSYELVHTFEVNFTIAFACFARDDFDPIASEVLRSVHCGLESAPAMIHAITIALEKKFMMVMG
jgi:hypothetical protein